MDLLLRRMFGKSSEKLDPRQLVLAFAELTVELSAETAPPATSPPTTSNATTPQPIRKPLMPSAYEAL
ncbi:MAG: hypothetical protein HC933_13460 [Pleurocapsa sp. SU_196_0]|nr:hypothetical protein [Pleurocapsa sp. SU_196_0]